MTKIIVDLEGYDLQDLLGSVLPHVGADPEYPPLTVVTLTADGDWLHAMATDRYTLGIARYPLGEAGDTLTVTVAGGALKAVVRQVKPGAKVRLTLTEQAVTIEQVTTPHLSYRLPTCDIVPPLRQWRAWLAERLEQAPVTPASRIVVDPAYLARFRSAGDRKRPLEIHPTDRGVVITAGDRFLGMVGPMNTAGIPDSLADWLPASIAA